MSEIIKPYKAPHPNVMRLRISVLEKLWLKFLDLEKESDLQYYLHMDNVGEVIKRQDQRMYYYKVFHQLNYPCEYKYIAIECFWLNTLKPFMVIDNKSKLYDCPNEKFSLFLILSTIREFYDIYYSGKIFQYPSSKRIKDILYDFKYCSFTREAMIAYVETLADTYGVGIEFILNHKDEIAEKVEQRKQESMVFKLFTKELPKT